MKNKFIFLLFYSMGIMTIFFLDNNYLLALNLSIKTISITIILLIFSDLILYYFGKIQKNNVINYFLFYILFVLLFNIVILLIALFKIKGVF